MHSVQTSANPHDRQPLSEHQIDALRELLESILYYEKDVDIDDRAIRVSVAKYYEALKKLSEE